MESTKKKTLGKKGPTLSFFVPYFTTFDLNKKILGL